MKNIISILSIIFLFSCNNSNKNDLKSILDEKIRYRGDIGGGQFVNFNYNDIIGSVKLDTIPENLNISEFISRYGKQGEVKIVDTEKISIPYSTKMNDVDICCSYDTTIIFSEILNNKKYIMIPRQYISKGDNFIFSFNTIFEVISPKSDYTKKRIDLDLPMWGLKIGDYIDKNEIDSSIEKDEISTTKYQFLKKDRSIKISTLEFENSNKLLITHIEKEDLTETEFNNFIDYIKSKYPYIVINKTIENKNTISTKYEIHYYGLYIRFVFSDFNMRYTDLKTYRFEISDSYTTTKRIIENEGKKFIYKQGFKVE